MSEVENDVDQKSRWQVRYYDALDELEDKEKSWHEIERLLRQLISRLTLAADDRHTILTKQLTELRNAVRDGRDILQMRDLIESISQNVAELDKIRRKDRRKTHPAVLVTKILEELEIPSQLNRNFRKLKKDAKKLARGSAAEVMNAEFVAFIKDVIDPPIDEKKEARKSKLLNRIFQRYKREEQNEEGEYELDDKTEQTNGIDGFDAAEELNANSFDRNQVNQKLVAPAVGDLLLHLTLRLPDVVKRRINFKALKRHTNRARSRRDLLAIVDVIVQQVEVAYASGDQESVALDNNSIQSLSTAISTFFSQIESPVDLRERLGELEVFYSERRNDPEALIHCLNSLADVVAEICQRLAIQRSELESFFLQLSMRLKDLDAGLQKSAGFNAKCTNNSTEMDLAVHDEIDTIQESIQSDDDITQLKQTIKIRLDMIDQHLQVFGEKETERLQKSNLHITELQEKIEQMEEDSDHLRSRLEETQHQAYMDVLTGIPNRNAYENRISKEVARCRRYNSMLSIIVWDVDKFKLINDGYGHAAGDRVLKIIAENFARNIRETDFLARFGGEEFVMLLPEVDITAAQVAAEKLRRTIFETPFHFRDCEVSVTVSAGVAQLEKDETANSLFERADKALYAAKESGRNRTEVAG